MKKHRVDMKLKRLSREWARGPVTMTARMMCIVVVVAATAASLSGISCLPTLSPDSQTNFTSPKQQDNTQAHQERQQQQQQAEKTATAATTTTLALNCSAPCTEGEFAIILETITESGNSDILKRFGEIEQLVDDGRRQLAAPGRRRSLGGAGPATLSGSRGDRIRPVCLEELINLIKSLAANELEMRTVFEFATSDSLSDNRVAASGLSGESWSSSASPMSLLAPDNFERIKASLRSLDQSLATNRTCVNGLLSSQTGPATDAVPAIVGSQYEPSAALGQSKQLAAAAAVGDAEVLADQKASARFIPKLINSVDHWIGSLERFTMTKEWSSLMKVFQGTESILEMFVNRTSSAKKRGPSKFMSTPSAGANQSNMSSSTNATSNRTLALDQQLEKIRQQLPGQVMSMTSSLSGLFPWHVWPWNNMDLYATVDTFLNHGIFAFSKTTVGPQRRIDNLPQMLRTLFEALKHDTFPRTCADWSHVICDQEKFNERLSLRPPGDEAAAAAARGEASKERGLKVKELGAEIENKLTQEITCIMFSSLSVQHFGGLDKDLLVEEEQEQETLSLKQQAPPNSNNNNNNRLPWDRQVRKAIKLYTLAREALTDDQWLALYNLVLEMWSEQKIPDRVVKISRVVQLLTNCHMPKEMLESALWKDIYKYKNVLNQLLDLVVEELNSSSESGKFKIEQMSFGSKSLQIILEKFIRLLPRLIESLSRTTIDELPELVGRFFNEKQAFFNVPCKGYSFADIIPSLAKHRTDIVELEELLCKQFRIKPNITMMQINNLTNDFLAMALNFSSFGGGLSFPKLYTDTDQPLTHHRQQSDDDERRRSSADLAAAADQASQNATSIIDEIAANPRMAQIVAILQSSALDPPEVHAVLPELDWVEAGTSIAMLYESIQKLLSFEQVFSIFPELGDNNNFQDDLNEHILRSREMFKKFSKRDPIRLVAYSLDTMMPIALRTFRAGESFNSECLASFRDIFSELDIEATIGSPPLTSASASAPPSSSTAANNGPAAGPNRQWQCFVSSLNFASWATNQLLANFNQMFKNLITQMASSADASAKQPVVATKVTTSSNETSTDMRATTTTTKYDSCIFLDGSVSLMLDNLPQFIDLALETVLMASTSSSSSADEADQQQQQQQLTLYDILCSSNYVLDPFDENSIEMRAKMKEKMCHLFHRKSLENCAKALELEQWKTTMGRLNSTWFESNALALSPSFREITLNMHKLLELFGQFKPSTMSDSLIARLLNVNSFWSNLSNRIMNIIDKYQEKRFEYALQTLTPIIYDNIPKSLGANSSSLAGARNSNQTQTNNNQLSEIRETLTVTILGANAVLNYLNRQSIAATNQTTTATNMTATKGDQEQTLQEQIQSLFNWADQYSMVTAETVLKTVANNITKLESIFKLDSSSAKTSRLALDEVWHRFCSAPIDQYLELKSYQQQQHQVNGSSAGSSSSSSEQAEEDMKLERANSVYLQMREGKEILCNFRWYDFYFKLSANSSTYISKSLLQYPESQLTRIALTKWGQVLDAMLIESKHIKQLPKFFYMSYWQEFKDKLPQISPLKEQPSNLIWIWRGFEQIVNAIDSSGKNQTANSLFHILDQLNCGLDAVKGGLSWDNIANIYQDRQDILAAHSTINSGFALASIGVDTLLTQRKFQKFLDEFVRPNMGLNSFCDARNRTKLEAIFSIPDGDEFLDSLESFQELICDTSFETLARNINPISVCYQQAANQRLDSVGQLASTVDRFFKLASLAILDAKLIAASEAKPPLLDKNLWSSFWLRWSEFAPETNPSGSNEDEQQQQQQLKRPAAHANQKSAITKRRVSLGIFRALQVIDSVNSNSLIWNALFKATHELCEIVIYLKRVVERRNLLIVGSHSSSPSLLVSSSSSGGSYVNLLLKETNELRQRQASSLSSSTSRGHNNQTTTMATTTGSTAEKQQLVSIFSNILFPEINNFISFRTFKQLRYMKTTSDYFLNNPAHYRLICGGRPSRDNGSSGGALLVDGRSDQLHGIRLIGLRLDSADRLASLLCHYEPSQWLRALNIATSNRSPSISKKVNLMTKYMSAFMRAVVSSPKRAPPGGGHTQQQQQQLAEFDKFAHIQQLDNVGTAINLTISYLLTTTDSLKSLSFRDLTNISWRSLPNLFDSIDRHLCASKYEPGKFYIPSYEPKRMKLETIMCQLPHWNLTQVYDYFSENFDLHNMISLITTQQQQREASSTSASSSSSTTAAKATNTTTVANSSKLLATNHKSINSTTVQQFSSNNTTNNNSSNSTQEQHEIRTCATPFKFASRWLKIGQELASDFASKDSRSKIKKCMGLSRKELSIYSRLLGYVKLVNSFIISLNDLGRNDSWFTVKKTWSSFSHLMLEQTQSTNPKY